MKNYLVVEKGINGLETIDDVLNKISNELDDLNNKANMIENIEIKVPIKS